MSEDIIKLDKYRYKPVSLTGDETIEESIKIITKNMSECRK